ncbi:hypothetical protein ACMZOO_16325 [Catenovulum sp. SX2]|uniref:hypothetical protein n=1 Tax=Catenovulum sp. SX2 TaxID=3398614 RepID=UPI003F86EFD8
MEKLSQKRCKYVFVRSQTPSMAIEVLLLIIAQLLNSIMLHDRAELLGIELLAG